MPQRIKYWGISILYCINIQAINEFGPPKSESDDALVLGGIFPTHFSVKNICPSLTILKKGLITLPINKKLRGFDCGF